MKVLNYYVVFMMLGEAVNSCGLDWQGLVACRSCSGSFSRVLLRQAIGEMRLQRQVVMSRNHLKNQVRLFA